MQTYNNVNDYIRNKTEEYQKMFPEVKELIIYDSSKPEKRLTAEFFMYKKHYTIHFGLLGAFTFADGAPEKKRKSYQARASKITNKNGDYTYMIAGTANSFAYHILW